MTTATFISILLVLLILLTLFIAVRQRKMAPKSKNLSNQIQRDELLKDKSRTTHYSATNWQAEWRTNAWGVDKEEYKAISKAMAERTRDMPLVAVSRIQEASKNAAITAYQQASESGAASETARKVALDVYRSTYEVKVTAEYWLAEWQKNARIVDGDEYRTTAHMLEDEHGFVSLNSPDAIDRVTNASTEAAIAAYQQASESGQGDETSRKAALEAYKTTYTTKLAEEKERQADPSWVRKHLNALSQAQIQQIEQRMHPDSEQGAGYAEASVSGFIKPEESLLAIVANDERTLAELGITPEQIADCLELYVAKANRIQELARRGQLDMDQQIAHEPAYSEGEIPIDEHFSLRYTTYMGTQACPFEDEVGHFCRSRLYGDTDFTLRNLRTNATLVFPGLIIHLIREHHFFEGSVKYRVDPRHAVEVLELQPGISYRPRYKQTSVWRVHEGTAAIDSSVLSTFAHLQAIRDNPETTVELDKSTHLYVRGDHAVSMAEHECQVPADFMVAGAIWGDRTVTPGVWGFVRSAELYVDL